MMLFFGHLDAEKGWTKQLHLGARRNNNTRRYHQLGPDTGYDWIGDWPQAARWPLTWTAWTRRTRYPRWCFTT